MSEYAVERKSARNFTDQPVSLSRLKEIIQVAQRAPSWGNTQPWQVYLAIGETAERIRTAHISATDHHQKSWSEVMPPQEWSAKLTTKMTRSGNAMATFLGSDPGEAFSSAGANLFNAPALIYITVPINATAYNMYDTGAFGYGILLAAQERGIAAIPAYEFVRYPEEIRQNFDIPKNESILMGIGLGYASTQKINQIKTIREPLDSVLQLKS